MKTRQPVVSEPLQGRIDKAPLILIVVAALATDGTPAGVIVGTLALASSRLFLDLGNTDPHSGSRSLVMSRSGVLMAHSESARVLGRAADEPGLAEVFAQWRASGSRVTTEGTSVMFGGYLVSMAGIAASDWVLVRMTLQSIALRPVVVAQRTAWLSAAGVGLAAALLVGFVAWFVTRPISILRARAERMPAPDGPRPSPGLHTTASWGTWHAHSSRWWPSVSYDRAIRRCCCSGWKR